MRSKSKRILIYIMVSVILSLNLIGCGESVNLTEEQTELVSEYAAGLLLKYEKGHAIGLSRVADIKFEELDVTPTPTPTPEPTPEPEETTSALQG